jgi:hypothetical protein
MNIKHEDKLEKMKDKVGSLAEMSAPTSGFKLTD